MWIGVFIIAMANLFDRSFRGQAIGYTFVVLRDSVYKVMIMV